MKFPGNNLTLIRILTGIAIAGSLTFSPLWAQETGPPEADAPAAAPPDTLTAEQQREMELLLFIVDNIQTERSKRRDAAAALMSRGWPLGIAQLAKTLADTQELQLQRAIVQAVVLTESPPKELIEPMIGLLGAGEAELLEDLTAALSRFENDGVAMTLSQLAKNPQTPAAKRLGAITALGEHRQAAVIDTLIGLTTDSESDAIKNTAFDALARLTGISEHGRDPAKWQKWWAAHRALPRDRWLARLVQTLSAENRRLAQGQDRLKRRLADTYNQLYLATAEEQRPALLIQMLDDSQTELRLLGLRLIERQVLNAQAVPDAIRQTMRQHIADPTTRVRVGVVNLLRDLDDEPSVQIVLKRLDQEKYPAALQAYLSLLARKPVAQAIDPVLVLLAMPETRAAASRVLIAVIDRELADPDQLKRIQSAARQYAKQDKAEAQLVRLFGKVAEASDEPQFAALLKAETPALRLAAADAYMTDRFPLEGIMAHAAEPTLSVKAIEAAARRGKTLSVAEQLLKAEPQDEEVQKQWRSALVAIAGRLNAPDLVKLDQALGKTAGRTPLRIAVLSNATKLNNGIPHKVNALLTLAELQLQTKANDQAAGTIKALDVLNLTEQQTAARENLRLDLLVAKDDYEAALNQANRMLESKQAEAKTLATRLLDGAQRALAQEKTEQASALLARVPQLGDGTLDPAAEARLQSLREALKKLQSPSTPPAP